jgi:peptidoglycan/LPS O-acetylase OafA/YrhL
MGVRRQANYIPTLDGWRAIAILLVIGAHCTPALLHSNSLGRKLAGFFTHAGYGVDVFFAISGYLIGTLLLKEKQANGRISLAKFYTRRVFRILPPILVYLATICILHRLNILPILSTSEVIAVLLFFRNYAAGGWYTGHLWSLAIEEQFYMVIPCLLSMLRWRLALITATTLAILSAIVRAVEYGRYMFFIDTMQFRTENRIDALMCGVILALLLQNEEIREWMNRRLSLVTMLLLLAATAAGVLIFNGQPIRRTIISIALPLLIAHTVLHPDRFWSRWLEYSPLRWIGRMSYSIYIWQMLFLVPNVRRLGWLQGFPQAFVFILLIAAASYYFIEKPMIRIGHRLAGSTTDDAERPRPAAEEQLSTAQA